MQKENGRKHMTKEQLRQLLARVDAAAERDIPGSARRQMAHRPYQKGEHNGSKEKSDSVQGDKGSDRKTKILDGNTSGAEKEI